GDDAVTEQDWLTCDDHREMLQFLTGRTGVRTFRLFALACCHRIAHRITDARSWDAIKIAENYVEGRATEDDLRPAYWVALGAGPPEEEALTGDWPRPATAARCAVSFDEDGFNPFFAYDCAWATVGDVDRHPEEMAVLCQLLREIVGNPFRPATID